MKLIQLKPKKDNGLCVPDHFKRIESVPEPPKEMSPLARAEWYRIIPQLIEFDLLHSLNLMLIRMYCDSWGLFQKVQIELKGQGKYFYCGKKRYRNPNRSVAKSFYKGANLISEDFGFEPGKDLKEISKIRKRYFLIQKLSKN